MQIDLTFQLDTDHENIKVLKRIMQYEEIDLIINEVKHIIRHRIKCAENMAFEEEKTLTDIYDTLCYDED